ncbi:MAG: peptidase domain-containing ABC transporter [Muribaculaceae bacterium]|nr:peptidase domain-containing ABC transporter [Muribaculaceae bacterium]
MGFPFVKQLDSMQCGVSCMAMICRFLGLNVSISELEKNCHVCRDGVSFKSLSDLADSLHLDWQAARLSVNQLTECPLPCILHWNRNHFVVLYKISRNGRRYHIADPAKCHYTLGKSEFESHWVSMKSGGEEKGLAMFFEPTAEFEKRREEKEQGRRSFGFLWKYAVRYRHFFFQIILSLLLGCVLQLVLPFLTQWIVDTGIRHSDIRFIWLVLLGELMIVAGRTVTDFIRRWLLLHISMRVNISLLSDFFIKLLKLPMDYFETKLPGYLMQRMTDHARVQEFMTTQVLGALFTSLSFMVFGVVLLCYDPLIFLIFVAGSIVYAVWTACFLRKRKAIDYMLFEQRAKTGNRTYQFITNMVEIKLQDCERRRRMEWEDAQADLFEVQMKAMRLQQTQEAGSIFINEIKNILLTVMAAGAVIGGQITLGAMLAIQYIVGQLNSPVEQLMGFAYSVQDVKISLERINEIHTARNEQRPEELECRFGGKREIELSKVSFKYDRHSLRPTLEEVSIRIPEGKVTAIVGTSGSGKTTLVKLMLGYYPPLSGQLNISGKPLERYDLKWWRRHCGVVMQESVLFSESIARNIAVSDDEPDPERLEEAARIACIHDYVISLPMKYDTMIGPDGMGLSQGQKQRVLIARAVYKNPDFIFLDEATNSLDAHNERQIVDNLQKFYEGRTVVVVAHRLSTVRNADRIIVMEKGRVVEAGTHQQLVAAQGAYFNLVRNQLDLGC